MFFHVQDLCLMAHLQRMYSEAVAVTTVPSGFRLTSSQFAEVTTGYYQCCYC